MVRNKTLSAITQDELIDHLALEQAVVYNRKRLYDLWRRGADIENGELEINVEAEPDFEPLAICCEDLTTSAYDRVAQKLLKCPLSSASSICRKSERWKKWILKDVWKDSKTG
jgi:hypothetical protein